MRSVAIAIICKTPIVGQSKTRLSSHLGAKACAKLSACFIRDLAKTIQALTADGDVEGYAVYSPPGSEAALHALLPAGFRLMAQGDGGLGARLLRAAADLLAAGHAGAILVNSDSPTLPRAILRAAVEAMARGEGVVLGPALDGGYTLIGLSRPHAHLFEDIPWSTDAVRRITIERAREIGLPVATVPTWYDIDDAASLRLLEAELDGARPAFPGAELAGAPAPATRRFLRARKSTLASPAS